MTVIVQDPETGQFKRADADDRGTMDITDVDEPETFTGVLNMSIDAADLTTGFDQFDVSGELSEIVDFTDYLDTDEVFVAHEVELNVVMSPDRTATAEHTHELEYALRRQSGLGPTELGQSPAGTVDSVDIFRDQSDDDDILVAGALHGSGDFADSTNGLAGGADANNIQHTMNYPQMGLEPPAFDQDDELYVPARIAIDGSDDQGAGIIFAVTARGKTYDV